MTFRLTGLDAATFAPYFRMTDDELASRGARRRIVDARPGFPDRIELRDLELGETAILLNYEHQGAPTPFRASHAIYVGERSTQTFDAVGVVPDALRSRTLSLRAFDSGHMLRDATLVAGDDVAAALEQLLLHADTAYVHLHYARQGCYAARAVRA
ncbi:MAG TPA: DUF1203 domain-containing protein [Steroidobacteraceae bacterium]